MSRRITRVMIAVLLSLFLIAAAAPSVQARLGGILRKAESKNVVSMSVNNKALGKGSLEGSAPHLFSGGSMDSGHNCGSDPTVDY